MPSARGATVWRVERKRRGHMDDVGSKRRADFAHEAEVGRRLVGKNLRGVVRIYQVSMDTIWEQRLDTTPPRAFDFKNEQDYEDVRQGLKNLHKHGIVHLDVVARNVGWDETRQQWCLFDFDSSGIMAKGDNEKWLLAPPNRPPYKRALKLRREMQAESGGSYESLGLGDLDFLLAAIERR